MSKRAGNALMAVGAALVLAALFLLLWNRHEDVRAGGAAGAVLPVLLEKMPVPEPEAEAPAETAEPPAVPSAPPDTEMTEAEIDGYMYVGYLSIPALGLELPVMSSWSYEQLKTAPCRYSGSTKTDDLVISAHNYSRHFGTIKNLLAGDAVYFTDMDGVTHAYTAAAVETLPPTAVEDMTDSGFALTLFTCTYGGAARVTVRCDRAE